MLEIQSDVPLQSLNTMSVESNARLFVKLTHPSQLSEIVSAAESHQLPIRVLGGGSNIILPDYVEALVVLMANKGIKIIGEDDQSVVVKVQAGENWHEFVTWAVSQNFFGLENLALIPGSVGAAPVQNIGAYGVEVGEAIERVTVFDLVTNCEAELMPVDCEFGYRDSLFKKEENRYVILNVVFRLEKVFSPVLGYGPLAVLKQKNDLTVLDVYNEVVSIRTEKLPSPEQLPNAGSFFKNPIVTSDKLASLLQAYPDLVHFPYLTEYKLAAGWLIDKAGFKGQSGENGVGCYEKQALVIVNPEHASAVSVMKWASRITEVVEDTFGVALEVEPRHW
ncbi:UDP-N-acetylmuramate dehydrogenase [Reinekea sp. G2M2-21]|uniref:UDP-N-acetylmuramate dehydrogenase n=1 Tax=Reinekea sp. G2M2-21 TaxID=2788942 RepID=UPI0018AA149B